MTVGILALVIAPTVWSGISVQAAESGRSSSLPVAGPATAGGMFGGGAPGQTRGAGQGFAGGAAPGAGAMPIGGQDRRAAGAQGATGRTNQGGAEVPLADGQAAGATQGQAPAGAAPDGAQMGGGGREQVSTELANWLVAHRGNAEYILAVGSANQASSFILATGLPVMATGGFSGSDPILTAASLAQLIQDGTVRYFLGGGGFGGGFGGQGSFNVNTWVAQNCTAVPASELGTTATSSQLYDCAVTK